MILYVTGDLFQSPAQVLVNTVNTVGVMGKGVAYDFKRLFPDMFGQYRELCERGQLKIGMLWLYKTPNKWVLNFPTKDHWRNPSRLEYIKAGLEKFEQAYADMGIHSVAFPPLGCGNGQLDFETQVQPLMHRYLRNLPIDIFIYPHHPEGFVPEHQNPDEMRRWLRSEPSSLPFSEVWDDLKELLSKRESFSTIASSHPFSVRVSDQPCGLRVIAAGQCYFIPDESLLAFWQQLRTHGFSMRHIAPELSREVSYLMPLFAALPYVSAVRVADSYEGLHRSPVTGLQVLPVAFARGRELSQSPLFELS